ncbi:Na+/H+ antiporter subunit E [Actinomycetospora chlora]|uniref:Na+/H+ antiporter subunit E n=1 Tax=Actinomycetospora chlora TaxID=663608 RepID=A0ABP9CGR4_9PSEU
MNRPAPPDTAGLLRRLVPVVWLVLVWVLLWGTFTWANVLGGIAVALLVLTVFPLPPVPGRGWLRPGATLRAVGLFVRDLVVSGLQVAWQSLQAVRPGPPIRSSVVAVRLASSSEFVMAMITAELSLVPGSVVIEARPEEQTIYAHVLGVDDEAGVERFRAQVRRLESDLVDALGRPRAPEEAPS